MNPEFHLQTDPKYIHTMCLILLAFIYIAYISHPCDAKSHTNPYQFELEGPHGHWFEPDDICTPHCSSITLVSSQTRRVWPFIFQYLAKQTDAPELLNDATISIIKALHAEEKHVAGQLLIKLVFLCFF